MHQPDPTHTTACALSVWISLVKLKHHMCLIVAEAPLQMSPPTSVCRAELQPELYSMVEQTGVPLLCSLLHCQMDRQQLQMK